VKVGQQIQNIAIIPYSMDGKTAPARGGPFQVLPASERLKKAVLAAA
jgi:hypothetical protein